LAGWRKKGQSGKNEHPRPPNPFSSSNRHSYSKAQVLQLDPPYKIHPGTKVRVESVYDGSQKRLGVMGIMGFWFHAPNMKECKLFGDSMPSDAAGELVLIYYC